MVDISKIFIKKPEQWGLRGDPYLWDDLSQYFSNINSELTPEEFVCEFQKAYELYTGQNLACMEYIHIPKYSHGGMSSGTVCPEFWNNKALPLLTERFTEFILKK